MTKPWTWGHVADGARQINWKNNRGLTARFLAALLRYYFSQFGFGWTLRTIDQTLRGYGYKITRV